eukprot:TRINITY_DN2131_c0_g1_i3.p1 TRINITY_DN2131_c0_g1~~TRINITY_DN2131_c0_g1_i3.p1  ORF type:complete len:187 (+),score=29.67 TRINITY_DN2131_c0_g1_i3:42-563(+)
MSVVPGLPPPPSTHPASPQRNREGSPHSGYAGSPVAGYAASPYVGGSPHSGYAGSPNRYVDDERLREEARHREIAQHIGSGIGAQDGISGYRSPRSSYQPVNVGIPAASPVYDSPVYPVAPVSGISASPQYYGGSPMSHSHTPSVGTPSGPPMSGEGESPRRIRAWGAAGTLR